ncbi:MAG: hypothetical protein ACRD15_21955 [Vicinamibacterales bacterium]
MATANQRHDHICARQAVCFQCFKAGMEKVRARRDAWAQRSLPFEEGPTPLTSRAVAHREQMLAHLARVQHGLRAMGG